MLWSRPPPWVGYSTIGPRPRWRVEYYAQSVAETDREPLLV